MRSSPVYDEATNDWRRRYNGSAYGTVDVATVTISISSKGKDHTTVGTESARDSGLGKRRIDSVLRGGGAAHVRIVRVDEWKNKSRAVQGDGVKRLSGEL